MTLFISLISNVCARVWIGSLIIVIVMIGGGGSSVWGATTVDDNVKIKSSSPSFVADYKEYQLDHMVTHREAKAAINSLPANIFDAPPPDWCPKCSKDIMKYCFSSHLLHDHCCCDQRHTTEKMPWVEHECFVGDTICRPHIGSCVLYTDLKECCCDRVLMKQWQDIFSSDAYSVVLHSRLVPSIAVSLITVLLWLHQC